MSSLDEVCRFEPFRTLSAEGRELLGAGLVTRACERGAVAVSKGDRVSGAYFVVRGRLRVFSLAPNGAEATLYFLDPGETCILTLNCLFNDLLYPAWVQAETETLVGLIPGRVYRRLFEREPAIQNLTVHALSSLVFRLMAELELVHSSHHKQRLASFLLTHASGDGELQMTQQHLAGHLGTTREVIARLLREMVDRGWVRTRRGAIAIANLDELRHLVTTATD